MRLIIEHNLLRSQLGTFEGYQSRCFIKDDGPPYPDPPKYLAERTLEELAQRWLEIWGREEDGDVNRVLSGAPDGWSELTVKVFLSSGYAFSSGDVVVILAIEERIKRACEMFAFTLDQHRGFMTAQQTIEIVPPTASEAEAAAIRFSQRPATTDNR